ncbi:hypothetical protein [Bacillus sp. FJAT-45350]|uniref:hypothetical protein n=1 Tax=Bacillus sp. FJAT-45350 TaxID=2011014 RepID=UPI000BB858C1|nr:hypothetical protein [Bacillus sp. FJAT-45350]
MDKEQLGLDLKNQQKLMEMVVDKTLKKHHVNKADNDLSPEEKKNIKEIVDNIKTEVEGFLAKKNTKTEKDFVDSNPNVQEQQQELVRPKRQFHSANNPNTVRTFLNRK